MGMRMGMRMGPLAIGQLPPNCSGESSCLTLLQNKCPCVKFSAHARCFVVYNRVSEWQGAAGGGQQLASSKAINKRPVICVPAGSASRRGGVRVGAGWVML
jgi:hypothetical protein